MSSDFCLCGACACASAACVRGENPRALHVLTLTGQRMCLPQRASVRASIRSVRGGNGQRASMALQVPAPGISGPNLPASGLAPGLDKRWHLCYNILWQIVWQTVWHLERQSAWRISSIYNRHPPHSDVHV